MLRIVFIAVLSVFIVATVDWLGNTPSTSEFFVTGFFAVLFSFHYRLEIRIVARTTCSQSQLQGSGCYRRKAYFWICHNGKA